MSREIYIAGLAACRWQALQSAIQMSPDGLTSIRYSNVETASTAFTITLVFLMFFKSKLSISINPQTKYF